MDNLERELGNINRHSDGLAADLEETIKKLDDPTKDAEVKRELKTLVGKLKGIAGTYKPDPNAVDPTDPNVTGKPRDHEKKNRKSNKRSTTKLAPKSKSSKPKSKFKSKSVR